MNAEGENMEDNIRSTARTPIYSGTESSSWTAPTLSKMIDGYVKHTGKPKPESTAVKDLPSEVKTWIANRTLLGDATADTEADLIFFPCVNPSTDKLNEGALRAIISGRGAQANIPKATLNSAQAKARSLLEKEFGMATQEDTIATKIVTKLKELLGVNSMSKKEELLKTLRDQGVELEGLDELDESVLSWMAEHNGGADEPNEPETEDEENEDQETPENETLKTEETPSTNKVADVLSPEEKRELLDLLKEHKAEQAEQKERLVASLVANDKCLVPKDALQRMEVDVLTALAAAYEPGSYLGVGVVHREPEAIPAPPPVVLATKKAGE